MISLLFYGIRIINNWVKARHSKLYIGATTSGLDVGHLYVFKWKLALAHAFKSHRCQINSQFTSISLLRKKVNARTADIPIMLKM